MLRIEILPDWENHPRSLIFDYKILNKNGSLMITASTWVKISSVICWGLNNKIRLLLKKLKTTIGLLCCLQRPRKVSVLFVPAQHVWSYHPYLGHTVEMRNLFFPTLFLFLMLTLHRYVLQIRLFHSHFYPDSRKQD